MLRTLRLFAVGAFCAFVALCSAETPAQARSERAMAATAAHNCDRHQIASVKRSLSSANSTKLQHYCAIAHKSLTTVRFIEHHRVLVAPRYKTWWKVPDKKWRKTVRRARAVLRYHQKVLEKVSRKIEMLARPNFPRWLVLDFACIHQGEGAWNAVSRTTPTYYGGLQMDWGFMRRYGAEFLDRWGTANNWPVWAQLSAAVRAYQSGRGFNPWPNTAQACGLL